MLYLQKAKPHNASKWLGLVQQSRLELENWMPYLKKIKRDQEAEAYIQKNAHLDFYLGVHIYEIWASNTLVGLITLHSGRMLTQCVELAYWLGSDYRGKGYATQACQFLISKTFINTKITRVRINCLTTNQVSQAVAHRLCFKLKKEENQILYFEMNKKEWLEHYFEDEHLLRILEEIDFS
ncbi:GNAT family N-acetyltransferase [Aureispira anguillae]|uniref:GNAT family N-acetyltransferase n=1 Tax=Aureispira anguillae TaxID=2864201 RepID=A0A915YGJ8_9BACT|nr:GNAT family N-acetyltransferase [Aureispira anguillae]BDS12748.1 GNAT family N-acetyltransferase [Aureispira anguillae]